MNLPVNPKVKSLSASGTITDKPCTLLAINITSTGTSVKVNFVNDSATSGVPSTGSIATTSLREILSYSGISCNGAYAILSGGSVDVVYDEMAR